VSEDPEPAPDPEQLLAEAADDRARLDGLVRRVDELTATVEKLVADAASAGPGLTAEPITPAPQPKPAHPSLGSFVGDYLLPMFTRPTLGGRWLWCPHWWEHSEAVSRLTALWHAWEALRGQRRHRARQLVPRPPRPPPAHPHGPRRPLPRLRQRPLRPRPVTRITTPTRRQLGVGRRELRPTTHRPPIDR